MTTHVLSSRFQSFRAVRSLEGDWTRVLVPIGRVLFALLFLATAPNHFKHGTIAYTAAHGVPAANVLVPLSGVLALVGGLSVALGYFTRLGAWLLVLFLVPVTLLMHNFWAVHAPQAAQMEQIMFFKNVTILGGALLIAYFGGGPFSLDYARARRLGL